MRGQITFREPCFYDNPVTITISTRGTRVEIELSPLEKVCLGPDPSLFGFLKKKTTKKNSKEPLQLMSSRKRVLVSSREKIRPKVIYKMQQSLLFRKTEEHHQNELKLLFQEYYRPGDSGETNKKWASDMPESTLNKLRLHLSWTMGINTFEWDRRNIGEQTIITLKKLCELYGPLYVPQLFPNF